MMINSWWLPMNRPMAPPALPDHLADGFGGPLAWPTPAPLCLLGDRDPKTIWIINLPWASQDRPRATQWSDGSIGVRDTDRSRDQKKRVTALVKKLGVNLDPGPIDIHIDVMPPDRKGDLDNVFKPEGDGIVKAGAIKDDNMLRVQGIGAEFAGTTPDPFVRATLIHWEGEPRGEFRRNPIVRQPGWLAEAMAWRS